MSDGAPEPPTPGPEEAPVRARAGKRSMMPLVLVLLLSCVVGLAWSVLGRDGAGLGSEDPVPGGPPDPRLADAEPLGPPVVVAGRILLEVPIEPAVPVVVVDGGEVQVRSSDTDGPPDAPDEQDEQDEQDEEDEGRDEGLVDPGIDRDVDEDPEPPAVTLEPPPAGACSIVAWQQGRRLADPVTCDAQGRFEARVPAETAGRTAFELSVPGRLRAVVEVETPATGRARLPTVALGLAQTVSGQIVDGRGNPMAGVEIQAMPIPNLSEPEPWRTTSGHDGTFSFDTLPPGPLAMRAAPEGFDPTVVEAIAPQQDVLVTVQALMDLQGALVGAPEILEAAKVRLEGSGVWPAIEVEVDPDGSFVFARIPDGVYAIEAYVARDGAPEYATIPLENVTPDAHATLALVPARRVGVAVVDPDGRPVPGARISAGNSQVGLLGRKATTGDDGQARVGPLVPGAYLVRADADDFLPSDAVEVIVDDAEIPVVTLTLRRPGRIEGRVVDESGRPVAAALVHVDSDALFSVGESQARAGVFSGELGTRKQAAGSLGVTTGPVPEIPKFDAAGYGGEVADIGQIRTDADGRFVLRGLSPGHYTLQAVDGRFAASAAVEVTIGFGAVRSGVELVLRSGWPLTGRLLDGNHRPIVDGTIEVDEETAFATDRRGVFDAGRWKGRVRIVARAAGKTPRALTVTVDRPVDLELLLDDADARLDGRVADDNGRPIEDARITADAVDGLSPSLVAWTDPRGVWRLEAVAPGGYELEFAAPGYVPLVRSVELRPTASERVDVTLTTGWWVEVEVEVFGRGDPIARAAVDAGDHSGVTDRAGVVRLGPLSDPSVTVRVERGGYASAEVVVDRPAGFAAGDDQASVLVALVEGGAIEGTVTDYRGDPVPRSRVVVRAADTDVVLAERRADAQGQWSVEGLPEGDVQVEAFPPPDREEELAEVAQETDVLRGRVTRDVALRFDRR